MSGTCRLCGATRLTDLVAFADYPVFIGCTDDPPATDVRYPFHIARCAACGIIQQPAPPPRDILYREPRAFGLGRIWHAHYDAFFEAIAPWLEQGMTVMEIGGGNGVMLQKMLATDLALTLYDVEPHPQYDLPQVRTVRRYLDENIAVDRPVDLIYASHLVEHLEDVPGFLRAARRCLTETGVLVLACPNIRESFRHLHLNAFTTDHLNYFTPETLSALAARHGFARVDERGFRDHGVYLAFRRSDAAVPTPPCQSTDIALFHAYRSAIAGFADLAAREPPNRTWLFGAHAFTITFLRYLEAAGIADPAAYRGVLDNEPSKHDRRLTGTPLICRKPADALADDDAPTIIVYMGAYTDEICEGLLAIDPRSRLIRLDRFARIPLSATADAAAYSASAAAAAAESMRLRMPSSPP